MPTESMDQQPDWPPQGSAIDLPDGILRFGSTGQLWEIQGRKWVRVIGATDEQMNRADNCAIADDDGDYL